MATATAASTRAIAAEPRPVREGDEPPPPPHCEGRRPKGEGPQTAKPNGSAAPGGARRSARKRARWRSIHHDNPAFKPRRATRPTKGQARRRRRVRATKASDHGGAESSTTTHRLHRRLQKDRDPPGSGAAHRQATPWAVCVAQSNPRESVPETRQHGLVRGAGTVGTSTRGAPEAARNAVPAGAFRKPTPRHAGQRGDANHRAAAKRRGTAVSTAGPARRANGCQTGRQRQNGGGCPRG